ncbi:MAG: hypothetical protein ASARMPREDX12_003297 [Alectoria sarmentosa]|nr:MAG: hypothetical protein ASARMPREDX12_003297 [Alectoria sarmentosa]
MRLKVLYSFDNENKTNCLARWPQPIDIRTVYLDEDTQIGVIELKTCIQAIVAASPELVAALGQDYTVYAYDYSEYETPLVGQGMLSWVLASSSSTPSAPAHQSRTIVTGRVCKNLLGLFSSNSQETLEVKLRLVPVPTSLQSEYIESMRKYRDISQMMPEGFDPQAWTSFVQANPAILQLANKSRSQSPAVGPGQTGGFGIEHVQRLLSGESYQQRKIESQSTQQRKPEPQRLPPQNNNYVMSDAAPQLPRMPSPASSVASGTTKKRRGRPPGPNPRKSRVKTAARQASVDTGYVSNEEQFEEGPNKKRAKVMQAEWSGNTDFGRQPESLRVAASTAASIRIHQPTAVRPNNSLANSLEGPPREPTPIADPSNRIQKPQLPLPRSNLRRGSFTIGKKEYASPYDPVGSNVKVAESALTSPEASQAESSPVNIASSPPVYRDASTCPSSPNMPTQAQRFEDSGFMSGNIENLFEDDEMRPVDDEDLDVAAQYSKRSNIPALPTQEEPAAPLPEPNASQTQQTHDFQHPNAPHVQNQQLHELQRPHEPPQSQEQKGNTFTRPGNSAKGAVGLSRTASSGNLALPAVPASDPIRPTLNRSQTWSGHQAPHPASDMTPILPVMDTIERPVPRPRKGSDIGTGSGVRRKQAIQSKLASSVAAGEMPPFCENCGAIETPTWRKAWVKIHSGTPEHVVISEEEAGIIAWQTLQTDCNGVICLYRIVKKSVLKTDEGFTEILLCNPCGLWLHTRKCMRPKEVWDKSQNGPDEKRKRGTNGKRQRANSTSDQAANAAPSGSALHSSDSLSANDGGQTEVVEAESQLPPFKHRRASSQHTISPQAKRRIAEETSAVAALERAIRSSPHKFRGTEHVPIDVEDLTPQPTRRVLFPSPNLSGEAKSKCSSVVESSGQGRNENSRKLFEIPDNDQADKENCPPAEDDGLDHLFTEDHSVSRATTPTPASSSRARIFKTPKRSPNQLSPTTGDFFSSAAKALLRAPTTPRRTPNKDTQILGELTPFTAHLNQLLSDANNGNGSPGSNGFDFPSLPSLHNTPGRRTMDFDFSQFDSQDLLSTDVPMPSSPPAWFGVYEDPIEHGSQWGDYALPNSASTPPEDEAEVNDARRAKTPGLVVDENGRARIDFQAMA